MNRTVSVPALCAALAVVGPAWAQSPYALEAPPPPGFDRERAAKDTLAFAKELIQADTRNPPGNELLTARLFEARLKGLEGVETEVLVAAEGRANFVARLRATNPTQRPVLIMGHMDVVGAQEAQWSTPPLVPTEKDGYLYGRGAIDDKGPLAGVVAAFVQLAERRESLTRDVILLATAAEEGGPRVGIGWVLENRPDVLGEAEFALNEGGRIRIQEGRIRAFNLQTTEKVYYTVTVTAAGPSGHGSVPLPDNALAALARAVARVHEWRPPVHLIESTRLYFARLAEIEPDQRMKTAMQEVASDVPAVRDAAAAVLAEVPRYDALLRAGSSLTILKGGIRENVIPSEGQATFNVRVVPGEDIQEIVQQMQQAGGEPGVTFSLDGEPRRSPPPSPVDSDLFRALSEAAGVMAPQAVVIPTMSTGATDGAALRLHGIPTYGILPYPLLDEDAQRMHGDDERVPLEALGWGAEYLYRTLHRVAGS
jgi:acetylornithine deacetylase/succinyl-diaminopimelate desuccinylase-like protein